MAALPWSLLGAIAMAVAVVLGAFGAHGLRSRVSAERLATWETAVHYHVAHALGLFAVDLVGLLLRAGGGAPGAALDAAGWLLLAGILLFSGSLYALTLWGKRWLGPITPLGGVAWIAGWVALAVAAAPLA